MGERETVDLTQLIAQRRLRAKAELQRQDLQLPARPGYDLPRLPEDVSSLGDEDLMALMVRFARYADHLNGKLAEAETDESEANHLLELAKAKVMVRYWTGASEDRVTIARAQSALDPDVLAHEDAVRSVKARRKMLGVLVGSQDNDASVVSRELTRRLGREPQQRRADRRS